MEISLIKAFNWNLHDLDETDIESLLPFVYRFTAIETGTGTQKPVMKKMYCDQVSWL